MIMRTASEVTLPTGVKIKDFDWYLEKIEIDIVQRKGEVCVRCTPDNDKGQPKFFYHTVNNLMPGMTILDLINKIKEIIPNSILKS